MSFFLAGGFPMVFILLFGGITVLSAVRFATDPLPGRARPVFAYGAAVGFAAAAGVCLDLAMVGRFVGREAKDVFELQRIALVGLSEALAPAVLGLTILSVTALLLAIGYRRLPIL